MNEVWRDKTGALINIGAWDFHEVTTEDEQGRPYTIISNPIPEGAYQDVAEIVVGWDGGKYEAGDPRAFKG